VHIFGGLGQKPQKRAAAGEKKAGLAREFGISRETLYQYLRDSATISEGSDV
jgi:hypothetical protein